MSKDTISWVHLSDLHLKSKPEEEERNILEALHSSLKELEPPDLLLITGDIAYGNLPDDPIKDQYDVAAEFLGQIVTHWQLDPTHVSIVPGNHDVNRDLVFEAEKAYTNSLLNLPPKEIRKRLSDLWTGTGPLQEQRRNTARRLEDFMTFLKKMKYTHLLANGSEIFFYANIVNINSIKIGIAGFNTTWSSYGNNEQGRLLFGMRQADAAKERLAEAQVRIALAHHPLHWIHDAEKDSFTGAKDKGYHFFLHGHEHRPGLSNNVVVGNHYIIGAGASKQDEDDMMCYYHMTLPINPGSAQMRMYYRAKTLEGSEFNTSKRGPWFMPGLSVAELIRNDQSKKPNNNYGDDKPVPSPNPDPVHYPIKDQPRRELVESRFTPLLSSILRELKSLLNVPTLALAFLPQRNRTIVPDIKDSDYNNYENIKKALLRPNNRFRKHELSSAVVSDVNGKTFFYNGQGNIPMLNSLRNILQSAAGNWNYWVDRPLSDQVSEWLTAHDKEIVCSLKYIPSQDNHDVVGYIIVPRNFRMSKKEMVDQDARDKVHQLVEEQLLSVLRHLVLERAEIEVQDTNSRLTILDTILEAAVSLSGADWGCIKSSTLGAASSDSHAEDCELVKAVCVHNCPRFYHEGRLVETEELVELAVKANEDMVLNLNDVTRKSFRHPAAQLAVFLIHDSEKVIEPQLPNSTVVGAIIVQHTAQTYLKDFEKLYSPFLRELAVLTSRIARAAAYKSLVKILKSEIQEELTDSFIDKVAGVVDWVASGEDATWILLQPDGNYFKMYKSKNELDGLQGVLIELIGAKKSVHDQSRLAAFVCNTTMSFQSEMLHYKNWDIQVGRVGITEFGADAHFQDEFERVTEELKQQKENRVIFNLGEHEVWWEAEKRLGGKRRKVSFVIGPIVSATGRPVGVLAVLREVEKNRRPWDFELLKTFEGELANLRDDLYVSHLALKRKGW